MVPGDKNFDEMLKKVGEIFSNKRDRNVGMLTGRGGAIEFTKQMMLPYNPTEEQIKEVDTKIAEMYFEPGAYRISNAKGLEYLGLRDDDMPDGTFATKSKGRYYLEDWKDGFRYKYVILSEEQFQELTKDKEPMDLKEDKI